MGSFHAVLLLMLVTPPADSADAVAKESEAPTTEIAEIVRDAKPTPAPKGSLLQWATSWRKGRSSDEAKAVAFETVDDEKPLPGAPPSPLDPAPARTDEPAPADPSTPTTTPTTVQGAESLTLEAPANAIFAGFGAVVDEPQPSWFGWRPADDFPTYASVEFIYWRATPPVVSSKFVNQHITQSSGDDVEAGFFGPGAPSIHAEPGIRAYVGRRFSHMWAVEAGGFVLNSFREPYNFQSGTQVVSSLTPTPVVSRVYIVPTDEELAAASLKFKYQTRSFEANARALLFNNRRVSVEGIGGFRYLVQNEQFFASYTPLEASEVKEAFRAYNTYVGGQVGAESQFRVFEYVSLKGSAKFAFTSVFQDVYVRGPDPASDTGVLTGANSLGWSSGTDFAVIADLGLYLVFQLTPNIQASGGYSAIWIPNARRVLEQIDFAAASQNPALTGIISDLWLSGLTLQLQIDF